MPYYVTMSRIDWHYDQATPELQAILPAANLNLSSGNHTAQTFEEQLRKLAAERRDLVVDALVEDGFRGYWLYAARDGKVSAIEVEERPEGALDQEVSLPFDDMATVTLIRQADEIRSMLEERSDFEGADGDEVTLPLGYAAEASMREVLHCIVNAIDEGEHRFVAETANDRFLVELQPGTASVRRLVVVTEPDLFARLLNEKFARVPQPAPRADEKREQALYWPEDMLQAVRDEARRLDASLSAVVQKAWKASRAKIAEIEHEDEELSPLLRDFSKAKAKQTLFFPGDMFAEICDQAARLDTSMSFVVQVAWVLARAAIAALPTP